MNTRATLETTNIGTFWPLHGLDVLWLPIAALPKVGCATEVLCRWTHKGRDNRERKHHEVLLLWPDGELTDHCETIIERDEWPQDWASF